MNDKPSHKVWIGCARAVAIAGVMVFHAGYRLALPNLLTRMSFYCVALFLLLGGFTTYLSMKRHAGESYAAYLKRRVPPLLLPYLAVVCCYQFARAKCFVLPDMLRKGLTFSYEVHLYYIFIYLQYVLAAPWLARLVSACNGAKRPPAAHALALALITAFAYAALRFTYLLPLSGNGSHLLGGNYLPCFYLGMVIAARGPLTRDTRASAAVGAGAFVLWAALVLAEIKFAHWTPKWIFSCWEFNPPSVVIVLQAVFLLFACQGLFTVFSRLRATRRLTLILDYIGGHSLYIYLYMLLIRSLIYNRLPIENIHLLRFVTFAGMILLPILGKKLWDLVWAQVRRIGNAGRERA